jgi:prepilin-type N-terminal cleavage/methylation domain-containing protein
MSSTYPAVRQAFTLIELLISIALGSLVVYVAVAGLRTTAQAISTAQRLSIENSILRAGMNLALQDNDFWVSHDDPMDCTKGKPAKPGPGQLLRQASSAGGRFQGLPFTPFLASSEYAASGTQMTPGQVAAGNDEAPTGWDPNAWGAHESRGWAWGNLAERVPVKRMVSKNKDGTVAKDMNGNTVYYPTNSFTTNDAKRSLAKRQVFGSYNTVASPRATSPHRWQQRQLDGLKRSLGSYGVLEYLPPNATMMLYSDRNPAALWSVSPEWCYISAGKDGYYLGTDDRSEGVNFAQDVMLATYGTVYAPANPYSAFTSANSVPTLRTVSDARDISNRRYGTGISLDVNSNDDTVKNIKDLMSQAEINRPWLDATSAPMTWPTLNVSTLRHRRTGASVCLHRITWTSPLTGAQTEFTFTAFGTTLRGARQQRLRDEPGWADPFPETGSPQPNLDSY